MPQPRSKPPSEPKVESAFRAMVCLLWVGRFAVDSGQGLPARSPAPLLEAWSRPLLCRVTVAPVQAGGSLAGKDSRLASSTGSIPVESRSAEESLAIFVPFTQAAAAGLCREPFVAEGAR